LKAFFENYSPKHVVQVARKALNDYAFPPARASQSEIDQFQRKLSSKKVSLPPSATKEERLQFKKFQDNFKFPGKNCTRLAMQRYERWIDQLTTVRNDKDKRHCASMKKLLGAVPEPGPNMSELGARQQQLTKLFFMHLPTEPQRVAAFDEDESMMVPTGVSEYGTAVILKELGVLKEIF
ncbi:MAG: hypothetical protein MI861_02670, partial [Pirellulales bacterium]|nr:hypothetical protein [Pirellulales bacterium]